MSALAERLGSLTVQAEIEALLAEFDALQERDRTEG